MIIISPIKIARAIPHFQARKQKENGRMMADYLIYNWLVVSAPLKNISQLGLLFPIYGKIEAMFQTTNQITMSKENVSKLPQNALQIQITRHRRRPGRETPRAFSIWALTFLAFRCSLPPSPKLSYSWQVHANVFDVLPTNRVLSINKCRVLMGIIYIME